MGCAFGVAIIQQSADHFDQLKIADLVLAPDVVAAAQRTFGEHGEQRISVVFDKQPVTDIGTIAVDRNGLSGERFEDDHRHQFFGEVVGAIVIAAVCKHYWQAISLTPSAHQVVARRF